MVDIINAGATGRRDCLRLLGSASLGAWLGDPAAAGAGTAVRPVLIVPDLSFDGYARLARDVLNGVGVCAALSDATPAQTAAALEALRVPLVRCRGVTAGGSFLRSMQAVRAAQAALGSVRPALFNVLATGYLNDLTPWSAQMPGLLAMLNAGVLWGIEAPNEINNPVTGGGSRGPNDTTNKTANNQYQLNFVDWATQLRAFKAANLAAFAKYGVVTLSPSLSPVSGTATDYQAGPSMNMEALADYWNMHFYAGNGFQPSLPFGANPAVGYFSNIAGWAQGGFSPTGLRQGVLTEAGATTTGAPGYARSGKSQAIYLANQQLQAFALNMRAVFTYCLFDTNGTAGDTEGNFGLFKTDKVTPKPAVAVLARMQDIRALNNNANDAANMADWQARRAFKPGLNAAQLAVAGVTSPPNGVRPFLAEHKSDGSSVVWVWNEPVVDSNGTAGQGGTDVTPADDPVTVYLPRSRTWRLHDPFATTALSADPWNTGDTVALTLKGYPMAIEVAPPPGWTATNGEPADVTNVGFASFKVGNSVNAFAQNYGGQKPDDLFVTLKLGSPKLFTPGNMAVIVAVTPAANTPTCAGATLLGRYSVPSVAGAVFTAWQAPITNAHASFTVTNTASFSSAMLFEVAPFSTITASVALCTWTGGNFTTGNTLTAALAAVPAGSLGLFAIGVPNESGGESYAQSTDTTVAITAPIINDAHAPNAQVWGGTIATGRAASNATWNAQNVNYATNASPVALTIVVTP